MFIMKININSKCILNTITPDFSIISTLNNKGKEEKNTYYYIVKYIRLIPLEYELLPLPLF